jgi:hypothetical protein
MRFEGFKPLSKGIEGFRDFSKGTARRPNAMSKTMQIDVRIVPFYEGRFEKQFPHMADLLRRMAYKELVEKEVSLYDMADDLETIARSPHTPDEVKAVISPYVEEMMGVKEVAREHLLARRLNELDQALYRMEDIFEDLEGAL